MQQRELEAQRASQQLRLLRLVDQAWVALIGRADSEAAIVACAGLAAHTTHPELVGRKELEAILVREPELVGLMCECLEQAKIVFGRDATFALEPFLDPEAPEAPGGTERVFLAVKTTLSVDSGNSRTERLDEWWLDQTHRASGLMSIAIEYASPSSGKRSSSWQGRFAPTTPKSLRRCVPP